MTRVVALPLEILARIIYEHLCVEDLPACLGLRLVNRYFDREVLHTLIDGGIFDRRFMWDLIHRTDDIHNQFALHYLQAFVKNARKETSQINQHRMRTARHRRHRLTRADSYSASSSADSDSSLHSWHTLELSKRRSHVRLSQDLLTSAIVLSVSSYQTQPSSPRPRDSSNAVSMPTEEEAWTTWTSNLCNAMIALLGARGSILFVGPRRTFKMVTPGVERYLIGKSAEFYALIAAAYSGNFLLTHRWLEQFRIDHRRQQRWLRRLNSSWNHFAWNSNKREKVWLEVLAACLTIAVKQRHTTLFTYLVDLEPGMFTPAFTHIRFGERYIIEEVIASQRLDYFQSLADKGWCLTRSAEADNTSLSQYEGALLVALNLSCKIPQRLEIIRILLIVSQDWQRSNNFRRLLLQAAEDNDTQLANLMLNLLSTAPIKWPIREAASSERRSPVIEDRDALDVAEMNGSLEMVHFLLRHRKQITSIVTEAWSYINPKRAVKQIIHRGEPSHMDCFREIAFAARDAHLGTQFTEAAAKLSTETLGILAQYVDLNETDEEYDIIVIEQSVNSPRRSSTNNSSSSTTESYLLPRPRPRLRSRGSKRSSALFSENTKSATEGSASPNIGETALAHALRALNWRNARFLVEELGVKLSWGSVKGIDVAETDETNLEALVQLRKLLAEHGMFMQTKMVFVPLFHPGQAASTTKIREHEIDVTDDVDTNTQGSDSRRTLETRSALSF